MALADENSSVYIHGAYQAIRSYFKDEDNFIEMFQSEKGLRWGEHYRDLFEGSAPTYKPNYVGNLVVHGFLHLEELKKN
jgi:hypothetical protein